MYTNQNMMRVVTQPTFNLAQVECLATQHCLGIHAGGEAMQPAWHRETSLSHVLCSARLTLCGSLPPNVRNVHCLFPRPGTGLT